MLGLCLLFGAISFSKGWPVPWYPLMVPIQTGGYHHRHTTHIVTHPVYHTRLLVLGSDDHHHQYRNNRGRKQLHGHDQAYEHPNHRYPDVQGRSKGKSLKYDRRPKTQARYRYHDTEKPHGGHEEDYPHGEHFSAEDPVKYSVPVDESPWKPLYRVPNYISDHPNSVQDHVRNGYVPLKYLGLDEEKVARVVKEAMAEIDKDIENESRPKYPTSIKDLIPSPLKSVPAVYRGAVFYDEDDTPHDTRVKTKSRHVDDYYPPKDSLHKDPQTFKLNIECQCLPPHTKW